ncbi:hypothetical protein GGP79_001116 [Salinibacter ruber]|nr:hypothetical protein [Salinibacter ruber]
MLKFLEQTLPIRVVPPGPLTFVFRSGVDLLSFFDDGSYKPSDQGQVLRRVLSSHLAVVLPEGHF